MEGGEDDTASSTSQLWMFSCPDNSRLTALPSQPFSQLTHSTNSARTDTHTHTFGSARHILFGSHYISSRHIACYIRFCFLRHIACYIAFCLLRIACYVAFCLLRIACYIACSIACYVLHIVTTADFCITSYLATLINTGVASHIPDAPDKLSALMRQADEALYHAKGSGRNRVCRFASGRG